MPSKHKRDFTVYVTPALYDTIQSTCEKTGHKRSALIEDILRLHFNLPPA